MSKFTNIAAASAFAVFAAASANATTVTSPSFSDTNSVTLVSPNDFWTESFELDFLTSFDVSFSGSGLLADAGKITYDITSDGASIASGSLATLLSFGSTGVVGAVESFYLDDDFTVSLFATGLSDDFSLTASIVSPSATLPAVPLPAGVFLLGGALGALGIARRKKA